MTIYNDIIGRKVSGIIDCPPGSSHPEFPDIIYPVNYGYVSGIIGGDGEFQDVYYLGSDVPLQAFEGIVIAVVHRLDDNEDKWIVAPEDISFDRNYIINIIDFQEKYFKYQLFGG